MNAISPQEPFYGLPRRRYEPNHRLLARSAALREAASETALDLGLTPAWQRDKIALLLAEHEALILRAMAAHHLAHGAEVLAKHYLRSARRVEQEAEQMKGART